MIEPHVMDRHEWMVEEHPWPAVAHDGAYLFAHIVAVAVDGACGAERLYVHARTADDAVACVVEETAAVGAKRGRTIRLRCAVCVPVSTAVEGNHLRHDIRFHCSFLFGVHASPFTEKVIRQGQIRCLVRDRGNFLDKQPRERCRLRRPAM